MAQFGRLTSLSLIIPKPLRCISFNMLSFTYELEGHTTTSNTEAPFWSNVPAQLVSHASSVITVINSVCNVCGIFPGKGHPQVYYS